MCVCVCEREREREKRERERESIKFYEVIVTLYTERERRESVKFDEIIMIIQQPIALYTPLWMSMMLVLSALL